MFKNLIILRLKPTWSPNLSQAEDLLEKSRFVPCGPTQMQSLGWIEPRGEEHGALIESVGKHWIIKLCVEKKVLPGSVVKRAVQDRVKAIEASTGRRPGKKETRDIKEEVVLDLLPKAFTKLETITVWLDLQNRFAMVDGSSIGKADVVISTLVQTIPDIGFDLVATQKSPMACMSEWLISSESPQPFELDRECELKASDESKAVVKYARHNLDIEEIKAHIAQGKVPTKLAMTYDGKVSLTLTDTMIVKKLNFLDVVFEDAASENEDSFDADFAIMTGQVSKMIPDLIEALGGEMVSQQS